MPKLTKLSSIPSLSKSRRRKYTRVNDADAKTNPMNNDATNGSSLIQSTDNGKMIILIPCKSYKW